MLKNIKKCELFIFQSLFDKIDNYRLFLKNVFT